MILEFWIDSAHSSAVNWQIRRLQGRCETKPVSLQVTKESRKAAVDDQFGGESDAGKVRHQFSSLFKAQNAYMLVYVRETEWDEIMCTVSEEDVALHLRERVRVRALCSLHRSTCLVRVETDLQAGKCRAVNAVNVARSSWRACRLHDTVIVELS